MLSLQRVKTNDQLFCLHSSIAGLIVKFENMKPGVPFFSKILACCDFFLFFVGGGGIFVNTIPNKWLAGSDNNGMEWLADFIWKIYTTAVYYRNVMSRLFKI